MHIRPPLFAQGGRAAGKGLFSERESERERERERESERERERERERKREGIQSLQPTLLTGACRVEARGARPGLSTLGCTTCTQLNPKPHTHRHYKARAQALMKLRRGTLSICVCPPPAHKPTRTLNPLSLWAPGSRSSVAGGAPQQPTTWLPACSPTRPPHRDRGCSHRDQ
jgi:hypothetical protein